MQSVYKLLIELNTKTQIQICITHTVGTVCSAYEKRYKYPMVHNESSTSTSSSFLFLRWWRVLFSHVCTGAMAVAAAAARCINVVCVVISLCRSFVSYLSFILLRFYSTIHNHIQLNRNRELCGSWAATTHTRTQHRSWWQTWSLSLSPHYLKLLSYTWALEQLNAYIN